MNLAKLFEAAKQKNYTRVVEPVSDSDEFDYWNMGIYELKLNEQGAENNEYSLDEEGNVRELNFGGIAGNNPITFRFE
ncbi:hypothetical protein [Paenibacillus amylolyticus]|uniref:Uncharacterized protein n=1 Tax=Paenibacillus amylolyticus TaxID=1451 RepID=A0A117I383_PAEAM|nr:hypothetical protein [Paenibacillus amylolyticus]GAS84919.1 unknown protein [Paenibacillus amylolyticus]